MKHIIVGTNRPDSRSLHIAKAVHQIYSEMQEEVEIIELEKVGVDQLSGKYQGEKPSAMAEAIEKIDQSEGLIFVVPEYNGSFPGALKYFIDHWNYPTSFEHRPMCFIGLGWQWGGLRPVEHLQQVVGYRDAYVFPKRVFMQNIGNVIEEDGSIEAGMNARLEIQAEGFCRFVKALKTEKLHANLIDKEDK